MGVETKVRITKKSARDVPTTMMMSNETPLDAFSFFLSLYLFSVITRKLLPP